MARSQRPPRILHATIVALQPVREADLIAVLLSPDHGKLEVFARNARKPSKRFGGRLQAFVTGQAEVAQGRGNLANLRGFTPGPHLLPMNTGYEQLALASYFAELASQAAQPEHADPQLHRWFSSAVVAAGSADLDTLAITKLVGELSWLAAIGALADPATCDECGESTEHGAHWGSASAGPVCRDCAYPMRPTATADLLMAVAALADGVAHPQVAQVMQTLRPGVIEAAVGARVADQLSRATRSLRGLQEEFSLAKHT